MNEAQANILIAHGFTVDTDIQYELTAYDQGKTNVSRTIETDWLQCDFPAGSKTEPSVLFLIYPSPIDMET